ncbi:MAG: hypothetical protein WDN09_00845 [bacterium]
MAKRGKIDTFFRNMKILFTYLFVMAKRKLHKLSVFAENSRKNT